MIDNNSFSEIALGKLLNEGGNQALDTNPLEQKRKYG